MNEGTLPPLPTGLQDLTYAALPYDTHPIDTAPKQPHGWGPFVGPWTPQDFQDPASQIDITWLQGDNLSVVDYGPGYDNVSLYTDNSLDLVGNGSILGTLQDSAEGVMSAATSTIANVVPSRGMKRLLSALGYQDPAGGVRA